MSRSHYGHNHHNHRILDCRHSTREHQVRDKVIFVENRETADQRARDQKNHILSLYLFFARLLDFNLSIII